MPPYRKPNVEDILKKYGAKIERNIDTSSYDDANYSREYKEFKGEMANEFSKYEKWCHSLGNVVKMKVSSKDAEKLRKYIDIAHLDIEPWQALGLGVMSFLGAFMFALFSSVAITLIKGSFSAFPFLYFFLMIIFSLFLFYFINGYPQRLANKWRLKASSQMVPAILYVVVYMRHTPNLEKAIAFAAKHLQDPLALDFKKIFYNVEVGKFSTIKESLDNYLNGWRDYSTEFIESFHLIESSLFEPDASRRISTLEKALQVILDGVYDKMLKFSHNVKSPITNVYMLGVVLPTLGLALIPLASAMLGGLLTSIHIFVLFNMIVPFLVFYMTDKILILRPGGHGSSGFLEKNPLYGEYKSSKHFQKAFLVCLPLFLIGLIPLIFQYTPIPEMFGLQKDYTFLDFGMGFLGEEKLFGFIETSTGYAGPFGILSVFLGLFIPLGAALFFAIAYKSKTKDLIKERDKTKQLEREFNNSLFQLGNRIGNGVPPELVFGKVAESSKGLMTESFFRKINYNIRQLGMGVEKAIFDTKRGAIVFFPSDLISTSMRVLIEASKKGLNIAAISLMSISEYVKNIQKITSRLRDLLAEVISDMRSNMTFLAPLLSGIVVGLSLMISSILGKLDVAGLGEEGAGGLGGFGTIATMFQQSQMISPYYLQIAVGIYLIEIIFILTSTLVVIDSGEDKLEKTNKTGKNLKKGIGLYFATAFLTSLVLFILSVVVLGNLL